MNIAEHFRIQQVERLDLSHYCRVASGCTVSATLKKLNETGHNCAFVMQQSKLVGIFTDRDVLKKVVDAPDRWADPIDSMMTRTPRTVASTAAAMSSPVAGGGWYSASTLISMMSNVTSRLIALKAAW